MKSSQILILLVLLAATAPLLRWTQHGPENAPNFAAHDLELQLEKEYTQKAEKIVSSICKGPVHAVVTVRCGAGCQHSLVHQVPHTNSQYGRVTWSKSVFDESYAGSGTSSLNMSEEEDENENEFNTGNDSASTSGRASEKKPQKDYQQRKMAWKVDHSTIDIRRRQEIWVEKVSVCVVASHSEELDLESALEAALNLDRTRGDSVNVQQPHQ